MRLSPLSSTPRINSTEERESLNFKLQGTKDYDLLLSLGETEATVDNNLGQWGHEFIRSLAGEIGQEYNARVIAGSNPEEDVPFADLLAMVDVIVPFNVAHNSEAEAVDLLIEVQRLKKILELDSIDGGNYRRICLYLIKTADFMSDPDDYTVSVVVDMRALCFVIGVPTCVLLYDIIVNLTEHYFCIPFSPHTGGSRNRLRAIHQAISIPRCTPRRPPNG